MGSLSELLAKEGFTSNNKKKPKFNKTVVDHDSIALPIYICRDRKTIDPPKNNNKKKTSSSSLVSSRPRRTSLSSASVSRRSDEPAIDEVATKAWISILSGYAGKYLRDKRFRDSLREKCCSCLVRSTNAGSDNGVFANMELGIESIEKLIDSPGTMKELKMKSLRNSIGFLTILNSRESKNGTTSGTPNSHLSACAQLYLSIVYKLEKNDRICARTSSRCLSIRLNWLGHICCRIFGTISFCPISSISRFGTTKKSKAFPKRLSEVYEDRMDMGTVQFALYYKEWLKTGGQPPSSLPSVPLPSVKLRRRSSSVSLASLASRSSINNFLHGAVFGVEKQPSMEVDNQAIERKEDDDDEEEELYSLNDHNTNKQRNLENRLTALRKYSSLNSTKPDYTWFLPCQSLQPKPPSTKSSSITPPISELTRAVSTISTSENLTECETAVRVMTKAWLNDPLVEKTLSKPSVIEGLLEVLFAATDEEIQELVISLLTEFVTRNEANGKIILSLDPQLEGFTNLMRNSSLFLKAASCSIGETGGQTDDVSRMGPVGATGARVWRSDQPLFSVRCSPQAAAYYFLDRLLSGFDEDRNLRMGGRVEFVVEKNGDWGWCRKEKSCKCCLLPTEGVGITWADNLNPELVLSLLVDAKSPTAMRSRCLARRVNLHQQIMSRLIPTDDKINSVATIFCIRLKLNLASHLAYQLVCQNTDLKYSERTFGLEQRTKLFDELLKGWDCLNTLQILLVSLQRATREQRPLVASIMFQLDLMGDPLKSSVYREESIEAITEALDSRICNENVQTQAAKALLVLGGRYGYTGTPEVEKWILKEAGYDESLEGGFHGRYYVVKGSQHLNEDDEIEHRQRKAAMGLWMSGGQKLIAALGESIANGIPCLARASLVTVAWMSKFVHTVGDGDVLRSTALLTMVRHLIESLNRTSTIEERVLASFSLLELYKSSGSVFEISDEEKKAMVVHLRNISKVTWTAKKLTSILEVQQQDNQAFNKDLLVQPSSPSASEHAKVKVKVRLKLHGIVFVESAQLIEEEEVEVLVTKESVKETIMMDMNQPPPGVSSTNGTNIKS
ncbi:LOW QUALITY PROTEIN: hypothetical protein OSB04_000998 [Centaurea solstitialis]|uniref:Uncharacterized protein n=1 Tax=Centaurea solstitialis TaxID=347529 RepID=A0AA38U8H4_9ASTR|nr:LOW QUALITY PROTEIN: hypothetical protein OSB04_000998 [Centaurea solstitialis]